MVIEDMQVMVKSREDATIQNNASCIYKSMVNLASLKLIDLTARTSKVMLAKLYYFLWEGFLTYVRVVH